MIINYSNEEVKKGDLSIFLAGPTPRNKDIISWRGDACSILERFGFNGIVYVPEYSTHAPLEDYITQVLWERIALMSATTIVFWIPRSLPTMPAFTTNVEFGYYLHTGKVIYGRPDNAIETKYLDWLYNFDYNEKPYNNLEDLLNNAILRTIEKED